MKPYPAYKPSGVQWLGEVPSHWKVKKVKHIALMRSGEGITAEDIEDTGSYPVYGGNGCRGFTGQATHSGEFVLVGRQGALCGNVHHVRGEFWASEHAVVSSFYMGDSPRWAAYMFELMNLGQYSVSAAQPGLAVERIQQLSLITPPVSEQEAIATYLDRETARIDELITEKGRLIDTLREYRQATISEVVTQGLDPAAPKKPSGVPWLGEVPAHWEIKSLRRVTDGLAMNGIFKKNDEFGEGAPLVNVTDLFSDNFFVDGTSLERVRCSEQELNQYQVCDGDLFLVRSSLKLDGIAMFAVARNIIEPTVFECHVVRLRPDSSLCNSRFMAFFLNSSYGRQSLISRSKSTTMTTIDQGEVLSTYIVSPPLDEQKAIAAYLDTETARTDKLIEHVREEIKLLHELRAATITDAVTGKIKVS